MTDDDQPIPDYRALPEVTPEPDLPPVSLEARINALEEHALIVAAVILGPAGEAATPGAEHLRQATAVIEAFHT